MAKRKTDEEFKKEVKDLVGDEYTFLQEYRTSKIKIKVRHNSQNCNNHEYSVSPNSFTSLGRRCPKCCEMARIERFKVRKTDKEFKEEVKSLVGDEYVFLEKYELYMEKLKVKHNGCGYVYFATPSVFFQGKKCPNCDPTRRKTQKEFEEEVKELVGVEYVFLEDYINTDTKINVIHTTCGHEYSTKPDNFFLGNRCPKCRESKGEKKVGRHLETLGVSYEAQQTFRDLVDYRHLRYDFSILDNNGYVIGLIEYDGEQHFIPVSVFGGEKSLKDTRRKDFLKDGYAEKNNIPLLRIPYWDFKYIEEEIDEFLYENGIEIEEAVTNE